MMEDWIMIVLPTSQSIAIIDALKAVGNLLDDCVVHLFVNNIAVTASTELADFTEATWNGYAASSAVVWGETYTDSNGDAITIGDTKQFHAADPVVAETNYGYYITDTAGTELKFAENFATPIPIVDEDDAVIMTPVFKGATLDS